MDKLRDTVYCEPLPPIILLVVVFTLTIPELLVNVLPPIEAGASCFNENSATDSKELRRLTLSPQA